MPDTVPCKICGRPTTMLGTKHCDPCHELDSQFDYLLRTNQIAANKWLVDKVSEALLLTLKKKVNDL